MNKGLFKNTIKDGYESGEIVYSISSPGSDWIRLDGTEYDKNTKINGKYNPALFNTIYRRHPTLRSIGWTTRTANLSSSQPISGVDFGNGIWVLSGGSQIRTSTDTITWVTRTSNFGNSIINSVAFGNNLWVAAGFSGQIRTSTDAITWVTQTSNFGATDISNVLYGNGIWVAVGYFGQIRTSTDAITWVTRTSNVTTSFGSRFFYFQNNIWVAPTTGAQVVTSTDAITWVSRQINVPNINTVAILNYYRDQWVGIDFDISSIIRSTDTITWTAEINNDIPTNPRTLDFGNGLFVSGTSNGTVAISADSINWSTSAIASFTNGIERIVYKNRTWLATASLPTSNIQIAVGRDVIRTPLVGSLPIYGWLKI